MSVLNYEPRVTKPSAFEDEVPKVAASPEEVNLTRAKRFDLGKYKDVYTEKLKQLIEAKVAGHEPAPIINLMDALKASLAKAQAEQPPPKKMAPSEGKERRGRKKKSS
jgi:non-homologous end joining protein Ku